MKASRALAIRITLVVIISILILGYGLFQARNLINGPEINISSPKNGDSVVDPLVIVSGSTFNITHITLNDRQIFVDKQGKFIEKLLVPPGYTIIKLAAQDKFGRVTQKLVELNYTGASSTSATSTQNIIQ